MYGIAPPHFFEIVCAETRVHLFRYSLRIKWGGAAFVADCESAILSVVMSHRTRRLAEGVGRLRPSPNTLMRGFAEPDVRAISM